MYKAIDYGKFQLFYKHEMNGMCVVYCIYPDYIMHLILYTLDSSSHTCRQHTSELFFFSVAIIHHYEAYPILVLVVVIVRPHRLSRHQTSPWPSPLVHHWVVSGIEYDATKT